MKGLAQALLLTCMFLYHVRMRGNMATRTLACRRMEAARPEVTATLCAGASLGPRRLEPPLLTLYLPGCLPACLPACVHNHSCRDSLQKRFKAHDIPWPGPELRDDVRKASLKLTRAYITEALQVSTSRVGFFKLFSSCVGRFEG